MDLGFFHKSLKSALILPAFGYFLIWLNQPDPTFKYLAIGHLFLAVVSDSWLTALIRVIESEYDEMNEVSDYLFKRAESLSFILLGVIVAITFFSYVASIVVYYPHILNNQLIAFLFFIPSYLLVKSISDATFGSIENPPI